MTDIRPDYFELSRHAVRFSDEIVEQLTGRITKQAEMFLREGFVITGISTLSMAADNFARFREWPGGGTALMDSDHTNRGLLIVAITSAFTGMLEAIDLTWSSSWVQFVSNPERAKLIRNLAAFSVRWREDREGALLDLATDWRRHYDAERFER